MLKTIVLTALTAVLLIADVPVLKTGQTVVYKKGDDGTYYKTAGKTRSYARNISKGIVTDKATNLQWQDNITSPKKNWPSAKNYCKSLNLDGKNWRLPTIYELKSIVDYSQNNPPVNKTAFKHFNSVGYWTADDLSSELAWTVNFFKGGQGAAVKKSYSNRIYVKCVRNQ